MKIKRVLSLTAISVLGVFAYNSMAYAGTQSSVYIVKPGDTLGKIAAKYHTSIREITQANSIANVNYIRPNQRLIIPSAGEPRNASRSRTLSKSSRSLQAGRVRMIWPSISGNISSGFGARWGKSHKGIDIAAASGSNVFASASGKVSYSGWAEGYGYLVELKHNSYSTRYAHLSKIYAYQGQYVSAGDIIGLVGSSGKSTGPHLHFEVLVNGIQVNPMTYLR